MIKKINPWGIITGVVLGIAAILLAKQVSAEEQPCPSVMESPRKLIFKPLRFMCIPPAQVVQRCAAYSRIAPLSAELTSLA